MSYVVTEACIGELFADCIAVCPVDCINGPINPTGSGEEIKELKEKDQHKDKQVYINPEECIDCHACLVVCPIEAI